MDRSIQWEFSVERNELPVSFSVFFRGTADRVLQDDAVSKAQCLHLIWLTIDFYRAEQGLDPWQRDVAAATFLQEDRDEDIPYNRFITSNITHTRKLNITCALCYPRQL